MASLSVMCGGWSLAVVLACVACGARTDLDELSPGSPAGVLADASSAGSGVDASTGASDALGDVSSVVPDASSVSPGEPDASCSTPTVQILECQEGNPSCCKFYVSWTCGDLTYAGGGGCGPKPEASAPVWNYGCFVNGQPMGGPSSEPATACPCSDPGAIAAFGEANCGPSSHP